MTKIIKILQISTEMMVLVICGLELRDAVKKIKEERKLRFNPQPNDKAWAERRRHFIGARHHRYSLEEFEEDSETIQEKDSTFEQTITKQ